MSLTPSRIVVLSFWLVNLVIAVITSSFQVTREEMHQSGFVSKRQQYGLCKSKLIFRKHLDAVEDEGMEQRPVSAAQRWYYKTKIIWIALIAVDLTIQALRTATMSASS